MKQFKVKKKDGNEIKKLPPAYPAIGEFENEFKVDYINTLKEKFLNKLNNIFDDDKNIEK